MSPRVASSFTIEITFATYDTLVLDCYIVDDCVIVNQTLMTHIVSVRSYRHTDHHRCHPPQCPALHIILLRKPSPLGNYPHCPSSPSKQSSSLTVLLTSHKKSYLIVHHTLTIRMKSVHSSHHTVHQRCHPPQCPLSPSFACARTFSTC